MPDINKHNRKQKRCVWLITQVGVFNYYLPWMYVYDRYYRLDKKSQMKCRIILSMLMKMGVTIYVYTYASNIYINNDNLSILIEYR